MHRRTLLSTLPVATLVAGSRPGAAAARRPVTIGIMGGEIDGTFMRIATDLTSVLNSEELRIVPIVGKGSVQNLGDLFHLPGADLALVTADAFAYAQAAHLYPDDIAKVQTYLQALRQRRACLRAAGNPGSVRSSGEAR